MEERVELTEEAKRNVQAWLDGPYDMDTKAEIRRMEQSDREELENAFYTHLSFGTGGMRGLMGIGPNRMNLYTVRQSTKGLANYLKRLYGQKLIRVAIGFDSRNNSQQFANEAARVLAAASIEAFIFYNLRPTPLVSFACRHLNCDAAIMITASHNPPQYNGYKVYWNTGGQVLPPHDKEIMNEIEAVRATGVVPISSEGDPYIHIMGKEMDEAYLEAIKPLSLWPGRPKGLINIVYSSLHGTGGTIVPQALEQVGVLSPDFVKAQMIPDGAFPAAPIPNPEVPEALRLGIQQMMATGADIFLATDPDADRLGVVVNHNSSAYTLSGNQIASIMTEYIFRQLSAAGTVPSKPTVVKTIVTSPLVRSIAEKWGGTCVDVLTGFKYIAQKMDEFEVDPEKGHYVFGCEESLGYLYGTHVRDKDGVICASVISEIAWHLKINGKTLIDALEELWVTYGYHEESQLTCSFEESKVGRDQMANVMKLFRKNPPSTFDGSQVVGVEDLLTRTFTGDARLRIGADLPQSDVLIFTLIDGSSLIVRPSGTEPKIKVYLMMKALPGVPLDKSREEIHQRSENMRANIKELISVTK
jgi:phosphoglucomutase/phosphomannomutase